MLKIGSHVSLSGADMYLGSVKEALSYGANCLMVYTGAPQNTARRSLEDMKIDEALKLMSEHNIKKDNIVVHAPYIINLANPDPAKREFAVSFLSTEIKRSARMNAKQIVLHPGNAVGKDIAEAINWIAEGLNKVIENTSELDTLIALETMAGKGTEVGSNFGELKKIIDLVKNNERISVCFDTCHASDAGYDIKNNFEQVIKQFDEIVGKKRISVFHINDSKNTAGAHKDRHANIGFGAIGFKTLLEIIYHQDFVEIPKILETPYVDNKAPYKLEIAMIKNKIFDPDVLDKIRNQ